MTTSAVFSQILPKVLPAELSYDLPREAVYGERQTTKFEPTSGNTYKQGQVCQILLPPLDAFADPSATYLSFDVSVGVDSKLKLPMCGAHGLIQTVRLFHSSGVMLDEIQYYNLLMATQTSLSIEDSLRDNVLKIMQGMGGAMLGTTAKRFAIPLKNFLFSSSKHLPLKYLGQIRVEITFAQGAEVLVQLDTDVISRDYTVTNVCLYTSLIKLNDQQVAVFDDTFRQRGLSLYGFGYNHHQIAWSTQNATLTISDRAASQKDIMVIFRDNATVSSSDDTKRTVDKLHARANKVKRYQWQVAGKLMPTRPVEGSVEALLELSDAVHGNLGGYDMTQAKWEHATNGSFLVARELETSRSVVSGDSTARDKSVDISVIVEGTEVSPACDVHAFVHRDKVVRWEPTGQISIFE